MEEEIGGLPAAPVSNKWGFDVTPNGEFIVTMISTCVMDAVIFVQPDAVDAIIEMMTKGRDEAVRRRAAAEKALVTPARVILGPDGKPMVAVPPSPEGQEHVEKLRVAQEEHTHVLDPNGDCECGYHSFGKP